LLVCHLSLPASLYALPCPGSPWGGSSMAAPGGGAMAPPSMSSTCAAALIGGRTSSGGAADPCAGEAGRLPTPLSSTAPPGIVSPALTSADGTSSVAGAGVPGTLAVSQPGTSMV